MQSRHVSRVIPLAPSVVYDYAADVDHLADWAAGLADSPVVRDGDDLLVDSPMGRVRVRFVPRNTLGVLDHDVVLPSGVTVTNPMRVVPHPEGAEVIFTVRQLALSDDAFASDVAAVEADLARLAGILTDDGGTPART